MCLLCLSLINNSISCYINVILYWPLQENSLFACYCSHCRWEYSRGDSCLLRLWTLNLCAWGGSSSSSCLQASIFTEFLVHHDILLSYAGLKKREKKKEKKTLTFQSQSLLFLLLSTFMQITDARGACIYIQKGKHIKKTTTTTWKCLLDSKSSRKKEVKVLPCFPGAVKRDRCQHALSPHDHKPFTE